MIFYKMNDTIYPAEVCRIGVATYTTDDKLFYQILLSPWTSEEMFEIKTVGTKEKAQEVIDEICRFILNGFGVINVDRIIYNVLGGSE